MWPLCVMFDLVKEFLLFLTHIKLTCHHVQCAFELRACIYLCGFYLCTSASFSELHLVGVADGPSFQGTPHTKVANFLKVIGEIISLVHYASVGVVKAHLLLLFAVILMYKSYWHLYRWQVWQWHEAGGGESSSTWGAKPATPHPRLQSVHSYHRDRHSRVTQSCGVEWGKLTHVYTCTHM